MELQSWMSAHRAHVGFFVCAALLLAIDALVAVGVVEWIGYLGALYVATRAPQSGFIRIAAAVCIFCIVLGYFLSPTSGISTWSALVNRAAICVLIWLIAHLWLRQREVEHLLRDREARLQAIFDNEPACVKLLGPDCSLQAMNRAGLDMIEADNFDEVREQSVLPLIDEQFRAAFHELTRQVFDGQAGSLDFQITGLKGTARWLETRAVPLRDEAGRITSLLGVTRDNTEQRRLEESLRQSQKMEAFGQLAGGVAHDFNNLLTVIAGGCELLLAPMPGQEPPEIILRDIVAASERAAGLTRQLLAFSRKSVFVPKVLDPNKVVRETTNMLRRLIGEDIELSVALAPAIAAIRADPGQLSQAMINLALNARDAMPRGGKLTIESSRVTLDEVYQAAHPESTPGDYVMLTVSDSGCGMSNDIKMRIFEPFFTTKGPGEGTGLGLPVVLGIVKQSGGHVEVYSEAGSGTSVRLYFPATNEAAPTSDAEVIGTIKGNETILLVEDEESVREFTMLALRRHGYRVLCAAGGRQALELAESHADSIDLLITDVVMPEIGGSKLAAMLTERIPGLRVLYVSGYTEDAVVRHGILHEQVAFLQKPYSLKSLTGKVREVLNQS